MSNKIDHLSYSQISMWLRCPRQWYYRYIEGLKIPPKAYQSFGSAGHTALEMNFLQKIHTKKDEKVDKLTDCFVMDLKERWKEVDPWEKGEKLKYQDFETAGVGLITQYHEEVAPKIQPIKDGVESKIEIMLGGVKFVLRKDLETKKKTVDYKFSKNRWNQNRARDSLQASLYVAAGLEIEGKNKSFEFHNLVKTKTGKTDVNVLRTRRTKKRIKQDVGYVIETHKSIQIALKSGHFPRCSPESWGCSSDYCGYYSKCKGGKK